MRVEDQDEDPSSLTHTVIRPLLKWKGDPKKVIGLHRCDAIFGNPFWSGADPLPKWKGDPKKVIVVDLR